ncbi:MAG: DJ-1/PfpI family protein, partial [Clostridia bacterium]|nr:DJ-1/PfpI family protein [Clostridia bacterium]
MVYCFLAEGFEEIEALATVDILRRAGIDVLTVGVNEDVIIGAHQIP